MLPKNKNHQQSLCRCNDEILWCKIQDVTTSISIIFQKSPEDDESDIHLEARDRRSSCLTCFVTQHVKYNVNGSVSLHFSCLTGNLFHRFAEVIFNISCYSTCMLSYMTCYFRWTKLHVGQQAMLFLTFHVNQHACYFLHVMLFLDEPTLWKCQIFQIFYLTFDRKNFKKGFHEARIWINSGPGK